MPNFSVPKAGDKFLWVRFYLFGDVLQALADAQLIKDKFPDIKLDFMTKAEYVDVVRAQPYIDDVIVGEKSPNSVLKQTAKLLRERKYDWIASTFKGAHMAVLSWLGHVPNRLGDSHYLPFLQTANIYNWAESLNIQLRSRTQKAIYATAEAQQFAKEILKPLDGQKKLFCVIGASTPEKMWPTEYWIELLKPLAEEGWSFVINGYGEREEAVANQIAENLPKEAALNLVGKLNYVNMIGVVSECQAAIGNDTGPLHMAALCAVPTVGIFDYIQPVDVGYNMPWLKFAVAREENLQTFYAKRRDAAVLAELKPKKVREKFDELFAQK